MLLFYTFLLHVLIFSAHTVYMCCYSTTYIIFGRLCKSKLTSVMDAAVERTELEMDDIDENKAGEEKQEEI